MTVRGWLSSLIIWAVVAVAGLILSLVFLSPSMIGPVGVTIWFLVLFTGLGAVFTLAFYLAKTFLRLHSGNLSRLRYAQRQGLLVSGWVTGLLSLSSLRQLSVLDAILLAILLVIVEVYVRFRWP